MEKGKKTITLPAEMYRVVTWREKNGEMLLVDDMRTSSNYNECMQGNKMQGEEQLCSHIVRVVTRQTKLF